MNDLKSQKQIHAEIYKLIFSGKAFLNPMTSYIISLKHNISLFYQNTASGLVKERIQELVQLLEKFKQHTDDISGVNLNSSKRIYEILQMIEKSTIKCTCDYNPYKLCLGSVLNAEDLKQKCSLLERAIIKNEDDNEILFLISDVSENIIQHIQSDQLAYENLKMEMSMQSLTESLANVVYNTCANQILSTIQTPDLKAAMLP